MKKWILAGTAAIALTSSVQAADMSAPSPAAVVSAFSWTGFYIGGQVGLGNFSDTFTVVNPPAGAGGLGARFGLPARNSLLGGVFVGANYQMGSAVIGIEADVDFVGYNSSRSPLGTGLVSAVAADNVRVRNSIQWSLRGRLGYAAGPVLLYLTAGPAFANFGTTVVDGVVGGSISYTQTRIGLTAGAGVEYAFTPNVIARAEYRYTDFGVFDRDLTGMTATAPGAPFWNTRTLGHEIKQHSVRLGLSYLFSTGGSALVARY